MQVLPPRTVINESVVCAELDGEMVLLNVETGIYFGLDPLGSRIWALLTAGVDEAGICDALLAEYDVEPVRLRADVSTFLTVLETRGLVRPQAG